MLLMTANTVPTLTMLPHTCRCPQRDMIQRNPNVKWDDIAELDGVKRVLKESLVGPPSCPCLCCP